VSIGAGPMAIAANSPRVVGEIYWEQHSLLVSSMQGFSSDIVYCVLTKPRKWVSMAAANLKNEVLGTGDDRFHLNSPRDVHPALDGQTYAQLNVAQVSKSRSCFGTSQLIGTPLSYHRFMHFYSLPPNRSAQLTDCRSRRCEEVITR